MTARGVAPSSYGGRSRSFSGDHLGCAAWGWILHLLIGGLRDPGEPLAVVGAADDIANSALDPMHRADVAAGLVAQRGPRFLRARAVDGEALAARTLVHEQGGRADRPRQQPAAQKLERVFLQIRHPQIGADAF